MYRFEVTFLNFLVPFGFSVNTIFSQVFYDEVVIWNFRVRMYAYFYGNFLFVIPQMLCY